MSLINAPQPSSNVSLNYAIRARAETLSNEEKTQIYRHTDKLFTLLFIFQYVACIIITLVASPVTWDGALSSPHPHLKSAIFLGAAICSLPIFLAYTRAGYLSTRCTIAAAQMLFSALLIHVTNGRIESHFHIFGSLAFLAIYRDWRVFVPATLVTGLDHLIGGIYFPLSMYGAEYASTFRTVEHTAWVLFEDIFLILSCIHASSETDRLSLQKAELEDMAASLDAVAKINTREVVRYVELASASQDELRKINTFQKAILDNAGSAVIAVTADGTISSFNSAAEAMFGYTAKEAIGKINPSRFHDHDEVVRRAAEFSREIHCEISPGFEVFIAKALRGLPNTHEWTLVRKDGSRFPALLCVTVLRDAEGVPFGYLGLVSDISDRVKAESRLKLAAYAGRIGIWEWYVVDNQIVFDDTMLEIYGIKKSEFIGAYETWAKVVLPKDLQQTERELELAIAGKKPLDTVFRIIHADGSMRYIRTLGTVERDGGGNAVRMVGINHDITALKERELELERLRSLAESAMFVKSQFLANMSHEIRSPLTSILGFAEAAKEEGVTEEERVSALDTIERNGHHLLGVINDILDLSKIDAGALKVESIPISPVSIIENVRALMIPRVAEKGLSLIVNYRWSLPKLIQSDSLRFTQILLNLVSNAIKFTETGRVEINIWCDRVSEILHCSVSDTGIGLTEEQQTRLFQPFSQADEGTTRIYGGTGLGLSIAKQLVKKLGGEIAVASQLHVGSTFSFFVSTGDLTKTEWASSIFEDRRAIVTKKNVDLTIHGKILIADDAIDNRKLLEFALRKTGLNVTMVDNGGHALAKAVSEKFDLILLDMQMPIMDGYVAAQQMRKHGVKVPIIAFTANAMKHDVLKCISAGCTAHLPKPFTKSELIECLNKYIQIGQMQRGSPDVLVSEKFSEDPEFVDLIIGFVSGLETRIAQLSAAIEKRQSKETQEVAHKLCGSAGLLGYPALGLLANEIESAGANANFDVCQSVLLQIKLQHQDIVKGAHMMRSVSDITWPGKISASSSSST